VAGRFYTAFAACDAEAMGALYAPAATFTDPAFGTLDAAEARAMWQMLLGRAQDLVVTWRVESETSTHARVHWEARYTFAATDRSVVNRIATDMTLAGGLIVRQVDHFDFWRWSRQALGLPGQPAVRSAFLRDEVRAQASAKPQRHAARRRA
jgi:ketosteroid isomerase-like protein